VRGIGALIYREIWDVDIGSLVDADVCRRCLAFLAFLARYLLFLSLSYSLTKSISLLPVKVGEWNLAWRSFQDPLWERLPFRHALDECPHLMFK